MRITIHDDPDMLEKRLRALQKLKNTTVKVGLPASSIGATPHRGDRLFRMTSPSAKLPPQAVAGGSPGKAGGRLHFILAVQEHGSPLMHIPSRPVITPALRRPETRQQMAEAMQDAVRAAWEGEDPRPALEAAGQAGADGIRAYIDSHIPPPNSPATINGGWIYNRKAKKGVYVTGKGFDKPLFDTGALYNAFDYEIEE